MIRLYLQEKLRKATEEIARGGICANVEAEKTREQYKLALEQVNEGKLVWKESYLEERRKGLQEGLSLLRVDDSSEDASIAALREELEFLDAVYILPDTDDHIYIKEDEFAQLKTDLRVAEAAVASLRRRNEELEKDAVREVTLAWNIGDPVEQDAVRRVTLPWNSGNPVICRGYQEAFFAMMGRNTDVSRELKDEQTRNRCLRESIAPLEKQIKDLLNDGAIERNQWRSEYGAAQRDILNLQKALTDEVRKSKNFEDAADAYRLERNALNLENIHLKHDFRELLAGTKTPEECGEWVFHRKNPKRVCRRL